MEGLLKKLSLISLLGLNLAAVAAKANCTIFKSQGQIVASQFDALYKVLENTSQCPENVLEFRKEISFQGGAFKTTMVGNRGFHNPKEGSFSLFEIITGNFEKLNLQVKPGEFFIGHFISPGAGNTLTLDQEPSPKSLMIELIAWDYAKGFFNFYELRGNGKTGIWFYRGDSADILSDIKYLHRQKDQNHPQFGNTLRCSGCHVNGGPIMKELFSPNNDWWSPQRPLLLGNRVPDKLLIPFFKSLNPAQDLAQAVVAGVNGLQESPSYQKIKFSLSLQEILRPIFCPMEINFISDPTPFESQARAIIVSSQFMVNPIFSQGSLQMDKDLYKEILGRIGSHFPETGDLDADHSWLAPVKAYSDIISIQKLLKSGVVNEKFILSVLSVDVGNPALSQTRCELLRYLPETATPQWEQAFIDNLRQSRFNSAVGLAQALTDSKITPVILGERASQFLSQCAQKVTTPLGAQKFVALLFQRRNEVRASEISKNPLGQILEPGFRVIFPDSSLAPSPEQLKVGQNCEIF
jgi:hypothetical protein